MRMAWRGMHSAAVAHWAERSSRQESADLELCALLNPAPSPRPAHSAGPEAGQRPVAVAAPEQHALLMNTRVGRNLTSRRPGLLSSTQPAGPMGSTCMLRQRQCSC